MPSPPQAADGRGESAPDHAGSRHRREATALMSESVTARTPGSPMGGHRYLNLATFRRNGAEVKTPVWFAATDGKLYVFTAGDSGKIKRLRRAPRVRIAPCDARGRVAGDWWDATARIVAAPRSIERAQAAFRAKYGWRMHMLDLFSRLARRIQHRAWIEIEV